MKPSQSGGLGLPESRLWLALLPYNPGAFLLRVKRGPQPLIHAILQSMKVSSKWVQRQITLPPMKEGFPYGEEHL